MSLRIEDYSTQEQNRNPGSSQIWYANENATERYDPPALSLNKIGLIQDCSKAFENLFGYPRCDLLWCHVSSLFPQLSNVELLQGGQVNPVLKYLCRCGHCYKIQNWQGKTYLSNLSFVRVEFDGKDSVRLIVHELDEMVLETRYQPTYKS